MKLYIILFFVIIGMVTAQHYGSRPSGTSSGNHLSSTLNHRMGSSQSRGDSSKGQSSGQSLGVLSGITRGHSSGGISNYGGHRGKRSPQHYGSSMSSGHLGSVSGLKVAPGGHSRVVSGGYSARVISGGHSGTSVISGGYSGTRGVSGGHSGAILSGGRSTGGINNHGGHRGRRNLQRYGSSVSSGHLGSVSGLKVIPGSPYGVVSGGHSGQRGIAGSHSGASVISGTHSGTRGISGSYSGAGGHSSGHLSGVSSSHRGRVLSTNQGVSKIHG